MLTVKHVVDGREDIYLAPYGVQYFGAHTLSGPGGEHIAIPQAEEDNPRYGVPCKALYRGHAYVMNDAGATVGAYTLGSPTLPNATADSEAEAA